MAAVIGALRAELSASIAQFQDDMGKAADAVKGFSTKAEAISKGLEKVGARMSLAITAPLVLMAHQSIKAAKDVTQSLAQVESALASTGGRSGKTAAELVKSAKALETLSTFDDDQILVQVTANLLRFGNISGTVFDRAQQAAVNLSARLGIDLSAAAAVVGKALDQPVAGLQALSRLGVRFTEDQKKQIYALVASGKGFEAQGEILKQLEMRFEGAAAAARKASPDAALQQQWRDLQENIGALLIKVGTPLVEMLTGWTKGFNDLAPAMQMTIVQAGLVLAVIGPMTTALGALVTAIRLATVAIVFLTTTFSGVLILIGLLTAAVILYQQYSDKLKGAIGEQKNAHDTLREALDKAKASGEKITKTDADMAKGKLVLAAATLKAAEAQVKQQLAVAELNDATTMKDADSGWAAIGTPDAASSRRRLGQIKAALDQNARDQAALQKALTAPAPPTPKGGNQPAFSPNFDLGPKADQVRSKLDALATAATKDALDVRRFATGGLDPLGKSLEDADTKFEALRNTIQGHIKELKNLDGGGAEAKRTMKALEDQLVMLDRAHEMARKSAEAQYQAEKKLADLQAASDNLQTTTQIRDLLQQSGRADTPMGSAMQNLQRTQDQLAQAQADAAVKLQALENERARAAEVSDLDAMARLDTQIDLQRQYFDLVSHTTAHQIQAAETVNEAWTRFTDDLSGQLSDMMVNFNFDVSTATGLLKQLVKDLMKPAADNISGFIAGGVKALFAGGFADGGYIPPGQWGIAGEAGMEPVFGGKTGATVVPALKEGRRGGDTYVDARGADTAAVTRLAAVVAEMARREGGRVKSYNADQRARQR